MKMNHVLVPDRDDGRVVGTELALGEVAEVVGTAGTVSKDRFDGCIVMRAPDALVILVGNHNVRAGDQWSGTAVETILVRRIGAELRTCTWKL